MGRKEKRLKSRVVITGMGALSPLGNNLTETWEGICGGKSGIARLTKFECSDFETQIAGRGRECAPEGASIHQIPRAAPSGRPTEVPKG